MVIFNQLCIGSNFLILKGLQQGVHRNDQHLDVGFSPANINMGTHTTFSFKNTTVKIKDKT